MNADTYRTAFLKFLSEGMTYAEAAREFDMPALWRAAIQEMQDDPTSIHDSQSLLGLCTKAGWEDADEDSMDQCHDLWGAGWTSEVPDSLKTNSKDFWRQCRAMSLYWRAPSKRPGRPGRRYLSTNQAWNAMMRQKTSK